MNNVQYALKTLRTNPGVSFTIVSTLALGIGATTLIFSIVDALLLRPLPVRNPENLVQLFERYAGIPRPQTHFLYEFYRDVADHSSTLFDAVAQREVRAALERGANSEAVYVQTVSDNYFSALGAKTFSGRALTPNDDRVAVLSYSGWVRYFGRDSSVIGQVVRIGGHPYEIVGITTERFNGTRVDWSPDLFVPYRNFSDFADDPALDINRSQVEIVARLRPGVSLQQAQQEIVPIWRRVGEESMARIGQQFPNNLTFEMQFIERGLSSLRDQFRTSLLLVMAATGFLLLVVCSNVGGILLARAKAYEKEIAIRLALGAGRARILRQWFAESLVYTAISAGAGMLITRVAADLLLRWIPVVPGDLGQLRVLSLHIQPDLRIFGFCLGLCVVTTLLCALAPAWHSSRSNLYSSLKGTSTEKGHQRSQTMLCTLQVALCALLLIWASLMVRTLHKLQTANEGFDSELVVTFSIDPTIRHYNSERIWALQQRLLEGTRAIPNVQAAGIAVVSLMRGIGVVGPVTLPGQNSTSTNFSSLNIVTSDYFEAMGMRLSSGRDFQNGDADRTPVPSVVNETFVRRFFGTRNPIGETFTAGPRYEIVGVVNDTHYRSMREAPPPLFYAPLGPKSFPTGFDLHVRTERSETIIQPVRDLLKAIDSSLPLNRVNTLAAEINRSLWQERLTAVLAATFGLFSTILAGIGLYGILTYFIVRYRRELGIRLAIGATPFDIAGVVSRRIVPIVALGLIGGSLLFIAVARWIQSVLYGVQVYDPISIAVVLALVLAIAIAAAAVPTIRAVRLDPSSTLRES